jgi:hypothetical protein
MNSFVKIGAGILLAAGVLAAQVGHASVITYKSELGPEVGGATGSGAVALYYDALAQTLGIDASWAGLSGPTTVAHIHCCTAEPGAGTVGVAVTSPTLPGFPAGVTSGAYAIVLDLTATSTFSASFLTASGGTTAGAAAALLAGLDAGTAYLNIHTTTFPGGEIRGFPTQVTEPATLALLAGLLGLVALGVSSRRELVSTARRVS